MIRPVWLYWQNLKNSDDPPYVTLCRFTMLHNWSSANLIFLTPENLDHYLPGLTRKIEGIESSIHGRYDRFMRRLIANPKSLAVRADVIRANLLCRYGGIYVDSSAIALAPLDPYFETLEDRCSFLVSRRISHGRSDFPVSFYGSRPQSKIIQRYVDQIDCRLRETREFDYNGLGTILLSPIVRELMDDAEVLDERDVMPVTFEDAEKIYLSSSIEPEEVLSESAAIFKLFNAPFRNSMRNWSIRHLYESEVFIGKLFRLALPRATFDSFMSTQVEVS